MGRNQWNWQYENNRKNQGFLKINKTYSKTEKKKEKPQITNIRNETGNTSINCRHAKYNRECHKQLYT